MHLGIENIFQICTLTLPSLHSSFSSCFSIVFEPISVTIFSNLLNRKANLEIFFLMGNIIFSILETRLLDQNNDTRTRPSLSVRNFLLCVRHKLSPLSTGWSMNDLVVTIKFFLCGSEVILLSSSSIRNHPIRKIKHSIIRNSSSFQAF